LRQVVKGFIPGPAVLALMPSVRKECVPLTASLHDDSIAQHRPQCRYGYANSKPCKLTQAAYVYVDWDPGAPNREDYNGNDHCNLCKQILCDWYPHTKWRTGQMPPPVCVACVCAKAKQFGY
jgi:hypothetical protein